MKHKRKPDYQSLVQTLKAGKSYRIPLIELGVHPFVKEAVLGKPITGLQDEIEFALKTGYDFIKIQPGMDFQVAMPTTGIQSSGKSPAPDRAWAPGGSNIIASLEDCEKLRFPRKEEISYKRFDQSLSLLPDGMGVIGQYGDIFTLVWELMGFETFSIALYEDPELIRYLFDTLGNTILSMYETMAEYDHVKAVWYSDDIAYAGGLMIAPEFLEEYLFPYIKKIGEIASRRGIPFLYHSDGVLYSVMDTLIGSGVTSIHPIEPKSMDIRQVHAQYGDRLGLCGGIEVDTLARGTVQEIQSLTRSFAEEIGTKGGWCAGSSNSIPEYVPVQNYLAMVETVLDFGTI